MSRLSKGGARRTFWGRSWRILSTQLQWSCFELEAAARVGEMATVEEGSAAGDGWLQSCEPVAGVVEQKTLGCCKIIIFVMFKILGWEILLRSTNVKLMVAAER